VLGKVFWTVISRLCRFLGMLDTLPSSKRETGHWNLPETMTPINAPTSLASSDLSYSFICTSGSRDRDTVVAAPARPPPTILSLCQNMRDLCNNRLTAKDNLRNPQLSAFRGTVGCVRTLYIMESVARMGRISGRDNVGWVGAIGCPVGISANDRNGSSQRHAAIGNENRKGSTSV